MIKLDHSKLVFAPVETADIWLECWTDCYAPEAAPVSASGLPRTLRTPKNGLLRTRRLVSPTNTQTPRFAPADWPQHQGIEALQAALACEGDRMTLDYLPADSAPVLWAKTQGDRRELVLCERAKVPVTDCTTSFDAFIQRRSKRERQRIRRMIADFGAPDSGYAFAVHDRPQAVAQLLPQCLRLEQAGWKGAEKTAILDNAAHARFYGRLATQSALHGRLRLATLHRHGRLIAFEYGLIWDDRLLALKTAYDEAFAADSPGHMLAVLHIRHCCEDRAIALYDVTGNGLTPSPHVMRYADRVETLYTLDIYARTLRGQMLRMAGALRRNLRILKRLRRKLER